METGGKTPHPPFATRGRFKQGNILVYSPVYAQNLDSLVGTGVPDGPYKNEIFLQNHVGEL